MKNPESSLSSVDLYCALMMGEIVPYYQPVIDAGTQSLHGLEVLMRWALADVDSTPVDLIAAFEEQGLMPEMTQHLLRQVAEDINELDALLPDGLHLSFNASPAQIEKPGFVFDTLSFLAALPLEKYRLVVEVTESQPLANTPEVAGTILKLQLADVAVYFDDFGTGCANLNCIEQFNVDGLKIDRLFVEGLSSGARSASIISLIASLAQSQKMDVIAEGVETACQSRALCEMGIQIQQGYLFSNALSKTQLQQYLAA